MNEKNGRQDMPVGAPQAAPRLRIQADGIKDPGVKRPVNEDDYYIVPADQDPELLQRHGFLYVVADGVGGNKGGQRASHLAVTRLPQHYYASPKSDPATNLKLAVQKTGQDILQEAGANPEIGKMGCTVAAMVVKDNTLTVAHVGDARAYLFRDGRLQQLTKDHTWVQQQVDSGALTEEEARSHPNRNVITRSLGNASVPSPTVGQPLFLQAGDRLLLCSDGLSGTVPEAEIVATLNRHPNPILANQELVKLANRHGGPDNIAAVVVNIGQPARVAAPSRLLPMLAVFAAVAIFLGVLATAGGRSRNGTGTPVALGNEDSGAPTVGTDQAEEQSGQATSTIQVLANGTPTATITLTTGAPAGNVPSQTPTPGTTPTPANASITVKSPVCGASEMAEYSGGQVVEFQWEWHGTYGENEYLEIRTGLVGQPLRIIEGLGQVPPDRQYEPGQWLLPVSASDFATEEGDYQWRVMYMKEGGIIDQSPAGCFHWIAKRDSPGPVESPTTSPNVSPPTPTPTPIDESS